MEYIDIDQEIRLGKELLLSCIDKMGNNSSGEMKRMLAVPGVRYALKRLSEQINEDVPLVIVAAAFQLGVRVTSSIRDAEAIAKINNGG